MTLDEEIEQTRPTPFMYGLVTGALLTVVWVLGVNFATTLWERGKPKVFHMTKYSPPIAFRVKQTRPAPPPPHKNAGLEEERIIWATEISWTGKPPDAVHRPDLTVTEARTGKVYVVSQPYDILDMENVISESGIEEKYGALPPIDSDKALAEVFAPYEDYKRSIGK